MPRRPIITLTSDFGLSDYYVAAMKAVLLRRCPEATLIDITHAIPRHDTFCGSFMLERAIDGFPPDTVHLAVVDPGVGTDRKLLVVNINNSWVVCPDNGLITWGWRLHPGAKANELTWRPSHHSETFHGRDIMAPVAAMLAAEADLNVLAAPINEPVLLNIAPALGRLGGEVIHIDHFGNAMTNILRELVVMAQPESIWVRNRNVGPLRRTYGDVTPGDPLALIGSSGLLEIAVRDGSAAVLLKIKVGDAVRLK